MFVLKMYVQIMSLSVLLCNVCVCYVYILKMSKKIKVKKKKKKTRNDVISLVRLAKEEYKKKLTSQLTDKTIPPGK